MQVPHVHPGPGFSKQANVVGFPGCPHCCLPTHLPPPARRKRLQKIISTMRERLEAKMGNQNNNAFKFRKLFQVDGLSVLMASNPMLSHPNRDQHGSPVLFYLGCMPCVPCEN